MANPDLGHISCPCCDEPAPIREAKGGKVYFVCTSPVCGIQGFTRSVEADKKLRAKMKPIKSEKTAIDTPVRILPPAATLATKKKGFLDDL